MYSLSHLLAVGSIEGVTIDQLHKFMEFEETSVAALYNYYETRLQRQTYGIQTLFNCRD